MAAKSPYLLGVSTDKTTEQLNRPIPKVLRLEVAPDLPTVSTSSIQETPWMSYVSPPVKSEWPSVSSKSKKAHLAPEYQFYYGDSTDLAKSKERNKKRTIRVPIDPPQLGAWARGSDRQQ
uniref:Uncharacterized protein n=1 Tax=viral metagenome TaxID=1070528 RepID=A0A6C0J1T5_9ZZZZ